MGHVVLRDARDEDLDPIFDAMRRPGSVRVAAGSDDRAAFDPWAAGIDADPRTRLWVVVQDGAFAGAAGTRDVDGEREMACWISPHAHGRDIAVAAVRQVVAREAVRPLYARAAGHDAAALAVLRACGFAEAFRTDADRGREGNEVVLVLLPVLDGL